MRFWLCKTEPDVYSIDDLKKDKSTAWSGVRNYQARNFMRDSMSIGDPVLIYHSNAQPPGVAGLGRVASPPHPDLSAFDKKSDSHDPKSKKEKPQWICIDVEFVEKFAKFVSLENLKFNKKLLELGTLKRGNRLSVMPVEEKHFREILKMAEARSTR